MTDSYEPIRFSSSLDALNRGFLWARDMALSYVREGFPAGPCYESALPGRDAFCMRDVSHQALGAHFLGLLPHNRNIMTRFAENISESKDWCSYWEINIRNEPCPADYKSDREFWYNLPANFDVLCACGRLYDWTGDAGYLTDPVMARFHRLTVNEYVRFWDRDGNGIVDRVDSDGCRGIASYDEGNPYHYLEAADTVALQAAAYREASRMFRLLGDEKSASETDALWEKTAAYYRKNWWMAEANHYGNVLRTDCTLGGRFTCIQAGFPVRYGLIDEPEKLAAQLDYIEENEHLLNIEDQTYMPEILWKNGRNDAALAIWLRFADENCPRREYPEVSYAMVESLVVGFLGLSVSAENRTVTTDPAVPEGEWAEVAGVPLWGGEIDLRTENRASGRTIRLTNRTGAELHWLAGENSRTVENGETAEITR